MSFVADNYAGLSPETVLAMATINGAEALGRPDLGSVEPGQAARLIYIELTANSAPTVASQLVTGEYNEVRWL